MRGWRTGRPSRVDICACGSYKAVKFLYELQLHELQVPAESGCGQNLKKLEIYDIIKG